MDKKKKVLLIYGVYSLLLFSVKWFADLYDSHSAFCITYFYWNYLHMTQILLVEDNDFVRMQIHRFLTGDGYDVVEAPDGLTALNLVSDDIQLAIVDIRMEPVDGMEFVKSLRAKNNQTPVIFVTGDQSPDLLSEASQLGVKATLMKPVEKERLLKMVARSIRK